MRHFLFEVLELKKGLFLVIFIIITYYSSAYLYYQYMLPYTVEEGTISLNNLNQTIEIDYHDPDISYRDLPVVIRLLSGDPLEITYMKCSDDFLINLTKGSVRFTHNFAGNIYIRLLNENSSATISYKIIDRTSLFIPKSATKACTSMPGIVFGFNITLLLIFSSSFFIIVYLLIYRRDLLISKFKQYK